MERIERKTKILFTIPTLQAGGAERVLVTLLNYWAEKKTIDVILLVHDDRPSFYPLHSNIVLIQTRRWKRSGLWRVPFETFWTIRKHAPQIVIPFILWNNILTLLVTRLARVPCIVSERIQPHMIKNRLVRWLRDFIYGWSEGIVVQTTAGWEMFPEKIRLKTWIIPNPVAIPNFPTFNRQKRVIGVGRLTDQKNFPLLINAFSQIQSSFPDWHLVIFGEGVDRNSLESLIIEKKLSQRIFLPGLSLQIYREIAESSLFVLSSKYEGMPNVLAEAMALGLPVISTDCPTGPKEMINHGENGLLVPVNDVDALSKSMTQLMKNERLRQMMGEEAAKRMKRYDLEQIAALWEHAWTTVLKG